MKAGPMRPVMFDREERSPDGFPECANAAKNVGRKTVAGMPDGLGSLERYFLLSSGAVLLLTATSKGLALWGSAPLLNVHDPVLGVPFRFVLVVTGLLEFAVAGVCLLGQDHVRTLGLVAWLSLCFVLYRAALWLLGWQGPCGCLGDIPARSGIPVATAERITQVILMYLLVGAHLLLAARFRARGGLVASAVCVTVWIGVPGVVRAEGDAQVATRSQVSNLVAFSRGELPIAHIEYGVDGSLVQQNRFSPEGQVYFEASYQPTTYYVRRLWKLVGNSVVLTNGIVYGENPSARWQIDDHKVFFSARTGSTDAVEDAVGREVKVHTRLSSIPLRVGFPEGVEPVALEPPLGLLLRTANGQDISAALSLRSDGLIETITYGLTNAHLRATNVLTYDYGPGERPVWMPSEFTFAADEYLLKYRKSCRYSVTHRIRSCRLGLRPTDTTDGFAPEMFLPRSEWAQVIAWTNGAGYLTEGTNTSRISLDPRSRMQRPVGWLPPASFAVVALLSLLGYRLVLRRLNPNSTTTILERNRR